MKIDLSIWRWGFREGFSQLLFRSGWLWYLPLLLAVLPLWQAWHLTCLVPRADHWNVLVEPWLKTVEGGPLWHFFHSVGTDSRHDAPKLLHYLVIKGTGWNLWVESMVCVVLGILAAAMALSFWRRHPGPALARWGGAWLTAFGILSPMQWMNWVWGIQICYALLVAASVAMIWSLARSGPIAARLLAAGVFALAAIFAFLNGWMAWGLGLAGVLFLGVMEKWPRRAIIGSVTGWLAMGAVAGWVYLLGWPESKEIAEGRLTDKLGREPLEVGIFFLRVLGGPFSELALLEKRVDRNHFQMESAPILGGIGVGLMIWALAVWWRRRAEWPLVRAFPWVSLLLFGLGNALAITVARVGKPGFLVFQSRYPGFTIWFWVGLMGLLIVPAGRLLRWVRWVGVLIMAWGMGVGAIQGWRDGIRDARRGRLLEAATAMRHAAVEPMLLDEVRPLGGEETITFLDRLDDLGLLHLARVKGEFVRDAKVNRSRVYHGAITRGRVDGRGIHLDGWALRADTRLAAGSVAVSYQADGQPERWLGLATRTGPQPRKAAKYRSREREARIGWSYEPLSGKETSLMTDIPIRMKRAALPHGAVSVRAYGFDPVSGEFSPLEGEMVLQLP